MVVIAMTNAPESLRGELTKWMIEPKAGVLVGSVSALVRDKLWEKVCRQQDSVNGAVMIYTMNNEQGYMLRLHGDPQRTVEDFEGVQLIKFQENRQFF